MKGNSRGDDLFLLADSITALVDKMSSSEEYISAAGNTATHRVAAPGLLRQLVAALPPGSAVNGGVRVRPTSKAPSAARIADLLRVISRESSRMRAGMRQEAQRVGRSGTPRTLSNDLLEIRSLAFACSDETVAEAAQKARCWVSKARVALTWDAPVVTLTEASCPYCGGELRVRADASSDVWCAGVPAGQGRERQPPCRDESGERRTWPRSTWIMLLERLASSA